MLSYPECVQLFLAIFSDFMLWQYSDNAWQDNTLHRYGLCATATMFPICHAHSVHLAVIFDQHQHQGNYLFMQVLQACSSFATMFQRSTIT